MKKPTVKWVNRYDIPRQRDGATIYHAGKSGGFELVTDRISAAILYDMKYFAEKVDGYTLIPITKKELFEARLKDK